MKTIILTFAILASALVTSTNAQGQSASSKDIERVIFAYRDALNGSDINKVLSLYTPDAVFLPANAPTATGTDQIRGTYQYLFANFTFSLDFTIGEIVVNDTYAFARSSSKGTMTPKAGGQPQAGENREFYMFEKINGGWKIARYMFNQPGK